eukprot:scaffold295678_cov28-Tisochrysis_lutea.AAC.6
MKEERAAHAIRPLRGGIGGDGSGGSGGGGGPGLARHARRRLHVHCLILKAFKGKVARAGHPFMYTLEKFGERYVGAGLVLLLRSEKLAEFIRLGLRDAVKLECGRVHAELAYVSERGPENWVEEEEAALELRLARGLLLAHNAVAPRVVGLPHLVALEEGNLHHRVKFVALRLPLLQGREFGGLGLAHPLRVCYPLLGDGVVVVRVDLGEGDDLQLVWVDDSTVLFSHIHVRKLVLVQLLGATWSDSAPSTASASAWAAANRAAAAALPTSSARLAAAASRDNLAYGMGEGGWSSASGASRLAAETALASLRPPPKEASISPKAELESSVLGALGWCAASCPSPVRRGGPRRAGTAGGRGWSPPAGRSLGFFATSAPGAAGP